MFALLGGGGGGGDQFSPKSNLVTINIETPKFLNRLVPRLDYSKTCVKQPPSKRPKIGFQNQLL